MKNLLIVTFCLFAMSTSVQAKFKIMTFNMTCPTICEKGKFDKFSKRKKWIVDTIKRNAPDIIGLQESLTSFDVKGINAKLDDYYLVYYKNFIGLKYADPAILFKKSKFKLEKLGGFWLGPNGLRFSFGWDLAFPRRVQWVRLIEKETNQEFYFITSHFDNSSKNKEKSAKRLVKLFKDVELPHVFAGDTNLWPALNGYSTLTEHFNDSFESKEKFTLIRNTDTTIHDSCNLEKGKVFPDCRVDHVLTDKAHKWRIYNWSIDQFKYGKKQKFTSDHRALIVEIGLNE